MRLVLIATLLAATTACGSNSGATCYDHYADDPPSANRDFCMTATSKQPGNCCTAHRQCQSGVCIEATCECQ